MAGTGSASGGMGWDAGEQVDRHEPLVVGVDFDVEHHVTLDS